MTTSETGSPYVLPPAGGRVGFLGITARGREGSIENTGNFLHGFAARYILGEHRNLNRNGINDETVERLRSELSHVAFVAATTLPYKDTGAMALGHAKLADNIEKLKLPLIVFGLGAQAGIDASVSEAVVGPETRRLLSVMSHHTPTIGVRGEFTADLCRHLGVTNVEVIGCQSCFISCRPDFTMAPLSAVPSLDKTVINVTKHTVEMPLIRAAMDEGATFIGQSSHFEYALKNAEDDVELGEMPEAMAALVPPALAKAFETGKLDFQKYQAWIKDKFFQYYSMEPWFEKLRTGFDASIGTRFHGNMAAMQMGIPSLWIVHDSRTKEFCEYLGLPSAPLAEVTAGRSVGELFDEHYETETFAGKYRENYRRYYDYLNLQGVPHRMAAPAGAA